MLMITQSAKPKRWDIEGLYCQGRGEQGHLAGFVVLQPCHAAHFVPDCISLQPHRCAAFFRHEYQLSLLQCVLWWVLWPGFHAKVDGAYSRVTSLPMPSMKVHLSTSNAKDMFNWDLRPLHNRGVAISPGPKNLLLVQFVLYDLHVCDRVNELPCTHSLLPSLSWLWTFPKKYSKHEQFCFQFTAPH